MYPRIAADFNGITQEDQSCCLILDSYITLSDLSFHRIRLQEGMRLVFWVQSDDAEDLEVDTVLCYEPRSKKWLGQFSAGAIRDVPAKNRNVGALLCFSCRKDVTEKFPHFWSHIPMICPCCGLSLMIPIEPPEPANQAVQTTAITHPASATRVAPLSDF